MLSEFISTDEISIFTLVMFVAMIIIGVGVFVFLFKQLTKPKIESVKEFPDSHDGIHEKNNPTPYGMHLVMLGSVVFSLWYIVFGFPLFHFNQLTQYEEEIKKHREQFNVEWQNMDESSKLAMGESIFNTQCVICHGSNARAQNGRATNLVEFGNEEHIIYVIKNGSKGLRKLIPVMSPQYEFLGATDEERAIAAKNVAAYVVGLRGKEAASPADLEAGKSIYMETCFACHGAEGKGAGPSDDIPNFSADLTQYGTVDYIKTILKKGKKGYIGTMPAFDAIGILSEVQYDAVSTYVATQLN